MPQCASRFPSGYHDKHLTKNPLARLMLRGHYATIRAYIQASDAASVLEIGCNRGAILEEVLRVLPHGHLVGCDLDRNALGLARRLLPKISFVQGSVYAAPFADKSFDVVILCEIIEHLERVEETLLEARRLARKTVILSVPNEPLWRVLNLARGAYWSAWGNTPGHVNHFSKKDFLALVEKYFYILQARTPVPWTMVLAKAP